MKVVVFNREKIDLVNSFANSEFEQNYYGWDVVDGCLLLTDEGEALDWISEWISESMAKSSRNENSALQYTRAVGYFLDFLSKKEVRFKRPKPTTRDDYHNLLLEVTSADIMEYLNVYLSDKDNSTRSFRDIALKSLYDEYICSINPFRAPVLDPKFSPYLNGKIYNGTRQMKYHNAISENDLMALMIVAKNEGERCLFQFMLDSGLRVGEIPRVIKSDFDDAKNRFAFDRSIDLEDQASVDSNYCLFEVKGTKPRGRAEYKSRITKVSTITIKRLLAYFKDPLGDHKKATRGTKESEKIAFLNSEGKPLTSNTLAKLLNRRVEKAKALGLIRRNKVITAHKFRHGFSILFLSSPDNGKDDVERMAALSKCLGHSKKETTEEFYEHLPDELRYMTETGESVTRSQRMVNIYEKTKPSRIAMTRRTFIQGRL